MFLLVKPMEIVVVTTMFVKMVVAGRVALTHRNVTKPKNAAKESAKIAVLQSARRANVVSTINVWKILAMATAAPMPNSV